MTLYGHPLAKELEAWWRDHGGGGQDPEWIKYLNHYATTMTEKFRELSKPHENFIGETKVFGMSGAGGCTRKAPLKLLGYEPEPNTGSTNSTFFIGHIIEAMAVASLKTLGYQVEGSQEPVNIAPMMSSYTDGTMVLDGVDTLLEVKSNGYKMGGKKNGRFERRGFAQLPFDGVKGAQSGWFSQVQLTMHAASLGQALVLVVAKDMIKAFEGDEYLGAEGNGSLTYYTELIPYDPEFVSREALPRWQEAWDAYTDGGAGRAWFFNGKEGKYNTLNPADENWMPNAKATGTYNPCAGYCEMATACKAELASAFTKRKAS